MKLFSALLPIIAHSKFFMKRLIYQLFFKVNLEMAQGALTNGKIKLALYWTKLKLWYHPSKQL